MLVAEKRGGEARAASNEIRATRYEQRVLIDRRRVCDKIPIGVRYERSCDNGGRTGKKIMARE